MDIEKTIAYLRKQLTAVHRAIEVAEVISAEMDRQREKRFGRELQRPPRVCQEIRRPACVKSGLWIQ